MYGTYVSGRMTSTTVYLTEEQQERLSDVSARLRVPKAVLIREGIELALLARTPEPHGAPHDCAEGLRETHPLVCDCDSCLNGASPCPQ